MSKDSSDQAPRAYSTQPSYAPIVELIAEHQTIIKVLAAFEAWADELGPRGQEDRLGLKRFLRFIIEFTDGCHHVKEEQILFGAMTRFGFSQSPGPVEVLTSEHKEASELIRRLSLFAAQTEAWQVRGFVEIRSLVKSYVILERRHIAKENRMLYPMAEAHLPAEAWQQIEESFAAIDEERECTGQIDETRALADQLINSVSA